MKLKNVYELMYQTENQEWHNLLFGNIKRAQKSIKENYYVGAAILGNKIINNTLITRVLF